VPKRINKPSKESWWRFTGEDEVFVARDPDRISRLYFPLCNEVGLLSSITPRLNGDIKTDQNHFLTLPVSAEDLHNTRSGRNFWIYIEGKEPWSAAGSSGTALLERYRSPRAETCRVEAGALWHRITRENRRLGLRVELTNFVPATDDWVEIMQVRLTNISRRPITITPTAAIPMFGRSADNLRDHRHVTSLLHRITRHTYGVLVTPTMSFDERGHKVNTTVYAVLGCEENGDAPVGSFPTVASFIGEGGTFDSPQAVFEDRDVPDLSETELQGREAVGALRFRRRKILPGKTASYSLLLGIAPDRKTAAGWLRTYGSPEKVDSALTDNKTYWKERLDCIQVRTGDKDFDRWLRWVRLQPLLRKIFGNSFLPDFDYGRGGRGWRDLWQDGLALLLLGENEPSPPAPLPTQGEGGRRPGEGVSALLLNNFAGVRMNGTNATIIGSAPGEFIADRNNISRTWMDHGVWPWITTEFYIHQTGDLDILLKEVPYFWDQDKAKSPLAEKGTVLEHLLVQHLAAYFNAGDHGNLRLEDADWNDGLDMAHDHGESVAFTAVFAGNLLRLAGALDQMVARRGVKEIPLAGEVEILLEQRGPTVELSPEARRKRLKTYHDRTREGVTGGKVIVTLRTLIEDLRTKGNVLAAQVRDREWLSAASGQAWFNGYYDNNSNRVEGVFDGDVRMTLTGQVFPIMSGVATDDQVRLAFLAAKRFLQDKKLGGFRLNTDFGDTPPPLGRAFAFAYGEKENGAFFSHMVVMFANALYQRGFVKEGFEVFSSLYRMCRQTDVAMIYPGVPEYFNGEGRGLYHYLTGSASWLMLTLVTQILGIRGVWGDLLLAPKLMPEQFGTNGQLEAEVGFAGKQLKITYVNRGKKPFGQYHIESVLLQGNSFALPADPTVQVVIPRTTLAALPDNTVHITVALS